MKEASDLTKAAEEIQRIALSIGDIASRMGVEGLNREVVGARVTAAFDLLLTIDEDELGEIVCRHPNGEVPQDSDGRRMQPKLWTDLPVLIARLLRLGPWYAPAALEFLASEAYAKEMDDGTWNDDIESVRPQFVATIEALQRLVDDVLIAEETEEAAP